MNTTLIVICGWCRAHKVAEGVFEPASTEGYPTNARISHGICPACDHQFFGDEANTCSSEEQKIDREHVDKRNTGLILLTDSRHDAGEEEPWTDFN